MASVLVVDDEPRIVSFVTRALAAFGVEASGETDSRRAMERVIDRSFDLILLDLRMPCMDGAAVMRNILAARPAQRIMILSALCDVNAKVYCLELGAIDFLAKPFALAELAARVRAHLRRPDDDGWKIRRAGCVRLDVERRCADAGDGPVPLSSRELDLLRYLIDRGGGVCHRDELLRAVWGTRQTGGNVVEACVRRLRAKLGGTVVETVRNAGYRIGT